MTISTYKAVLKKEKGKWRVWYPDPGWINCGSMDCIGCKPTDKERQLIASNLLCDTKIEAIEYALYLGYKEIDLGK